MLADDKVGEPVPLLEVPHAPAQVLILADIIRLYLHISTHIYTYLRISTHIYTYLHISTHPVQVEILPNEDCHRLYGIMTENMMCTSGANAQGSCFGDSGGPAIVRQVRASVGLYED